MTSCVPWRLSRDDPLSPSSCLHNRDPTINVQPLPSISRWSFFSNLSDDADLLTLLARSTQTDDAHQPILSKQHL